jgi:hypothetical protein
LGLCSFFQARAQNLSISIFSKNHRLVKCLQNANSFSLPPFYWQAWS